MELGPRRMLKMLEVQGQTWMQSPEMMMAQGLDFSQLAKARDLRYLEEWG